MSTSLKVVSIAAVLCASTSRCAIVARRFDMRTRSSRAVPFGTALFADRRDRLAAPLFPSTGRGGPALCGGLFDVALHDAPGIAAAGDLLRSTAFCSAALRAAGVARVFSASGVFAEADGSAFARLHRGGSGFAAPLDSRRLRRTRGRLRRRARPRRSVLDDAEHFADLHVGAVAVRDPAEHAGLRRRHLEIDLVGLELDQRLADVDGVPFLLQPLGDARVDDRLADFGDYDVSWHLTHSATSTPINSQLPTPTPILPIPFNSDSEESNFDWQLLEIGRCALELSREAPLSRDLLGRRPRARLRARRRSGGRERRLDQQLLLARVARGGSFGGAGAARPGDRPDRPAAGRLAAGADG